MKRWEDRPDIRAKQWVAWRLAEKGVDTTRIALGLDVTYQSASNYLDRVQELIDIGGAAGTKGLADQDEVQLQADLLAQAALNLATTATKEQRQGRPVQEQVQGCLAAIDEVLALATRYGEDIEDIKDLEAEMAVIKAKLRKKEAMQALDRSVKQLKATGDPAAAAVADIVDLVRRNAQLDDALRGESGR